MEVEKKSCQTVFLIQGQVVAGGSSKEICQQMEVKDLAAIYRSTPSGGKNDITS